MHERAARTEATASGDCHTLRNASGLEARVLGYGGIVQSLLVPDRDGRLADVVLGFERAGQYRHNPAYLGALIGRYANRIARGRFPLDGTHHDLAVNDPPNHLHGGRVGFDSVNWESRPFRDERGAGVELRYTSADGEEGYPGTLSVRVTYTLTARDELVVDYGARTDRATPVNLTQHAYFDLGGGGDVLGHVLSLDADRYTPVDAAGIPTGELRDVTGTPFDFRRPTPLGARIDADDEQLRFGGGYDHNFVLNGGATAEPRLVGRLLEPASGRVLELSTTEPGVQLYTANHLDGSLVGKGGRTYGPRAGVALETQHFPDSPNQPHFPSTILRPGEEYRSRTVYRFTTDHA